MKTSLPKTSTKAERNLSAFAMDNIINEWPCRSLCDQRFLNAIGLGGLLQGAILVGSGEEVVQSGGQVGALAEADAIFFAVELDGVGQVGCLLYTSDAADDV